MSEAAIKVENLGKVFRIYDRPSDRLKEALSLKREKYHTDFHALRNINFEVRKGEFIGIVGKNGAGKSTLLKILSRELTPTSGSVTINGKVSLLQLGVGFDPALTGIDNARFASKLLGYTDAEIESMLEEIIAFADIGEFIHHPVKTYSSGMYSRLSFAVGININPDILIADEVLSVGDMRFSQKCLRKMREFKEKGKTVIFVSHDIQSVNIFCDTAMWIKDGEIFMRGDAKHVTTDFQNHMLYDKLPNEYSPEPVIEPPEKTQNLLPLDDKPEWKIHAGLSDIDWVNLNGLACVGDGRAEIKRMAFVLANTNKNVSRVSGNEDISLFLNIKINETMHNPQIGIVIYNKHGIPAAHTNNDICGTHIEKIQAGEDVCAAFHIKLPCLSNGNYTVALGIQTGLNMAHRINDAFEFIVGRPDIKSTQCGYSIIETEKFELS